MGANGGGGPLTLFFLAVALGVVAAGWAIIPLVLGRRALLADSSPAGAADVEARRRVALAALKDVEYDRVSGKLDDEDYRELKAQLEREALDALTAADAATAGARPESPSRPSLGESPITHACGFVNPPGSRFCSGCGRPLG